MKVIIIVLTVFGVFDSISAIEPFHMSNDESVFKYPRDASSGSIDINNNLDLNIFCRDNEPKLLVNYFRTAKIRIISSSEDSVSVKLFKGSTPEDVRQNYLNRPKWFNLANIYWEPKHSSFSVFNSSCVGVSSDKPYSAVLFVQPIDFGNVAILLCGLLLFALAERLSQSTMLFYLIACIVGAFAFGILILFFVTRILLKMKQSLVTISVLWGVCLYYVGGLVNIQEDIFATSSNHVFTYLFMGAAVSFLICYRIGPPTHPRTLDIIKWLNQALGLLLIYMSSEYVETSLTIIGVSLMFYNAQKWI